MSRKKSNRAKRLRDNPPSRRKLFIITATILSLLLTSAALAQWAAIISVNQKSSSEIAPASFNAASPSKEYIYAGGKLVATEEPVSTSSSLAKPLNFSATVKPSEASQINLSWDPSVGADHYQIERSANFSSTGNGFSFVINVSGTTYTDTPPGSGVRAYMYRVRAADANETNLSPYSDNNLATTIIFTDSPLTGVVVKALHLTQVRDAITAVRTLANPNNPPVGWTNPSPQGVFIYAQHMQELRTHLNLALGQLGLPPMSENDPSLTMGNPILAVHLQAVRDKVT